MKKPLAIIWNDVHLKTGNEKEILTATRYMIEKALELGIKRTIFAGDLFHSRIHQRQEVLETFDKMLYELNAAEIHTDIISGNHDKTEYKSFDSFLDVYRHFPNVTYHREVSDIEIDGVGITLLPFFDDTMLVPMINEHKGNDILISHFEMQGSTHLGNVSEKKNITRKMLKKWDKTYLGHYHNWHEITKDIVHLPSFIQDNFGEDSKKGFSILYDDGSYELIQGKFKIFEKIQIDVDDVGVVELDKIIKSYEDSENVIRFEITGSESKMKSIDKTKYRGVDIKLSFEKVYEESDTSERQVVQKYEKEDIQNLFLKFCEDKGLSHKEGGVILDNFLNKD